MEVFEQEKRKNKRYNLELPLHYQIRGTQEFGSVVTKDISAEGISFISDRFIKPMARLDLALKVLNKNINFIGTVRWTRGFSRSSRYQIGLEMIEITSPDKGYISEFIDMHYKRKILTGSM